MLLLAVAEFGPGGSDVIFAKGQYSTLRFSQWQRNEALAVVIMNVIPQPGPLELLEAMPMQTFIAAAWTCEDIDENTAPSWYGISLCSSSPGVFSLDKHICRAQAAGNMQHRTRPDPFPLSVLQASMWWEGLTSEGILENRIDIDIHPVFQAGREQS